MEEQKQSQKDLLNKMMSGGSKEPKTAAAHRTEHQRGQSCTGEPLKYLAEYTSAHTCEETSQGHGENHSRELEGTVFSTQTRSGPVFTPFSQTGKP